MKIGFQALCNLWIIVLAGVRVKWNYINIIILEMQALSLLILLLTPFLSVKERMISFPLFTMPSSSAYTLQVNLPPISTLTPPITLDLHFRIDSTNGVNFVILGFANLGLEQFQQRLVPLSFPSSCDITTTLEANTWYHVSYSVSAGNQVQYAIDGTSPCSTGSLQVQSRTEPLKLFLRPRSSSAPLNVILAHLRYLKQDLTTLESSGALSASRYSLSHTNYISTVYDMPLFSSPLLQKSIQSGYQPSLSYLNLDTAISQSTQMLPEPTSRLYLTWDNNDSYDIQWNSNTRYTDILSAYPATIEVWLYMESTIQTYIFYLQSGFEMRAYSVSSADVIGCGYNAIKPTVYDFGSHFANYQQTMNWIHLACVLEQSSMTFFYNEESGQSSPITYSPSNPHTSGEQFIIGGGGTGKFALRELRLWRSSRSHGQILTGLYRHLDGYNEPQLIFYLPLDQEQSTASLFDASRFQLHNVGPMDQSNPNPPVISWLQVAQRSPLLCSQQQYLVAGKCEDTPKLIRFDQSGARYLTVPFGGLLDNTPSTQCAYEMWVWIDLINPTAYLFQHESSSPGTDYVSLQYTQSNSLLTLRSVFLDGITSVSNTQTVSSNAWHFVAVMLESVDVHFVVDDTTESQSGFQSASSPVSADLHIGYHNAQPTTTDFRGQMTQLRVWKSRDVNALLQNSHRSILSSETSLLGYWNLVPTISSSTIVDLSTSDLNIQFAGASPTFSVSSVEPGLPICQGPQIFTGTKCSQRVYSLIVDDQLTSDITLSLSLSVPTQVALSFYIYRSSSSSSPSQQIKPLSSDIAVTINHVSDSLSINLCGATFSSSSGGSLITDQWNRISLYAEGISSIVCYKQTINSLAGTSTCTDPLSLTILSTSPQHYQGVYMRDLVFYSPDYRNELIRAHFLHEEPDRSLIELHYPLSISEITLKVINHNPSLITTLAYQQVMASKPTSQFLYSDVDVYRWHYEAGVTDLPTSCEPGFKYDASTKSCVKNREYLQFSLPSSAITINQAVLPVNVQTSIANQMYAVAMWLYHNGAMTTDPEILISVEANGLSNMEGGFYPDNGDIHVRSFNTDTAFLSTVDNFYSKWHYMAFYRLGTKVGYCWDGVTKQSDPNINQAQPNPFVLYFGSTSGNYPYSGVLAGMSIMLRNNGEDIESSDYYLQHMTYGFQSSMSLSDSIYHIYGEVLFTTTKVIGILDPKTTLQHNLPGTSSFIRVTDESPLESFLHQHTSTFPEFSASVQFSASIPSTAPGVLSIWMYFAQLEGPTTGSNILYSLSVDYSNLLDCTFKSNSDTIEQLSLSASQWHLFLIGADSNRYACFVGERSTLVSHTQGAISVPGPSLLMSITNMDVARFTLKNLRYFQSVEIPQFSFFSQQWKLAYKSLHNYKPITMSRVAADFEFIYMGPDLSSNYVFSLFNSVGLGGTPFSEYLVQSIIQTQGPSLCAYDQIYNGQSCVSNYKLFFQHGSNQKIRFFIPPVSDPFVATGWAIQHNAGGISADNIIKVLDKASSAYVSIQVSMTSRFYNFKTNVCPSQGDETVATVIHQWFFIDLHFQHPQLYIYTSHLQENKIESDQNCFSASTLFEQVYLTPQDHDQASFKQFALFNGLLSLRAIKQMRAGFTPSPYEQSSLIVYYLLDGSDISLNQDSVINQVTGAWQPFNTIIGVSNPLAQQFVDPAVTTRHLREELPTCLNDDGLYLDPELNICKKITHYVFESTPTGTKQFLPLPRARDTSNLFSYTVSLWVHFGLRNSGERDIIEQGENDNFALITLLLDANMNMLLRYGPTTHATIDHKYLKISHWNQVGWACSQSMHQEACVAFANSFSSPTGDQGNSIFYDYGDSFLKIPADNNAFKYALIRVWSTIPGGSLANLGAELKKGALTIDYKSSPFLGVSYSLINGDIVDQVTGTRLTSLSDAEFSYYWVPTDFDGLPVGELRSQCIQFSNQQITEQLNFQSEFKQGFTVRFWYKLLSRPNGSAAVLLEHSNNFLISKQEDSNYSIIQYIHDPSYSPAQESLSLPSSLTVNYWDIVMYKLDKMSLTMSGKTYAQATTQTTLTLQSRSLDWSHHLPYSTDVIIASSDNSLCLRQLAFLTYPVKHSDFVSASLFFGSPLTATSKGIVFFMNPLHYSYSSIRSDLSDDQLFFCSPGSILCLDEPKVLTISPQTTAAVFPVSTRVLSQFTVMVLFKISIGSASPDAANILNLSSQLTVTYSGSVDATFHTCSASNTYSSPTIQTDWTALSVTYTGSKLKLQRLKEITESSCSGQTFALSGNIDLNQGDTGLVIGYSYLYIFSEWLTPGQILFLSFKKLSSHYIDSVLVTGYDFTHQPITQEPYIITDCSNTFSVDLLAQTGIEWDYTRQLNGGTQPALTSENAELQLCEEGQVWSRGGLCFPSTRTYAIKMFAQVYTFSFSGVSQYSFVTWIRSDGTSQSGSLFRMLNGASTLNIASSTPPKVQFLASGLSMTLEFTYAVNEWHQVGGTMSASLAQFFRGADSTYFTPGLSFSNVNFQVFQSFSIGDYFENFQIYLISLWSAALPILTLRQAVGNRVIERDSALLFLSFNFMYQSLFWDWIQLSQQNINDLQLYSLSSDGLLPWSQTCDLGSYSLGSECITTPSFICFTAASSIQTTPLDASALGIEEHNHSVLLWFSISQTSSGTGSVDIKFGETGFHVSITQSAEVSLSLGTTSVISSATISTLNTWHLIKASVNNNAALSASIQLSDGTFLNKNDWLINTPIPSSITMTLFSIESSLTGGSICIASATVFPLSLPNQLSLQFISKPFNSLDTARPVFLLDFRYFKLPFKEIVSGSSIVLSQTSFETNLITQDATGDSMIRCTFENKSYNSYTQACEPQSLPSSCIDPNSLSCSSSGTSLICDTGFLNMGGTCTQTCDSGYIQVLNFCFYVDNFKQINYSVTLNADNSFIISFDSPLSASEYDQVKDSLVISVDGTAYSSEALTLTPTYSGSDVATLSVDWQLDKTVRTKDEIQLAVQIQGTTLRGSQSNEVILNAQENPEFAEQIRTLNSVVDAVSPTVQSTALLSLVQAFVTDGALKYLWGVINASQLMALLPLIDVPVPPNVMVIFQFMAIANGDFQYLKSLHNVFREWSLIPYADLQDQKPLNANFEFAGYEKGSFFLLQQLKLLLALYFIPFLLLAAIFSFLLQCQMCSCCRKRLTRFFNSHFWVRLFFQITLDFWLTSLIACHSVFSNISSHAIDLSLTFLFLLGIPLITSCIIVKLIKNRAKLSQRKQKKKSIFTQELNSKQGNKLPLCVLLYYPFFLIERILFALILVFFRNSTLIGASLCFTLFFMSIFYLMRMRPLSSRLQLCLELLSKVVMLILICFFLYLEQEGPSISERYAMIAIIFADILVNLLALLFTSCAGLIRFMRKNCCSSNKRGNYEIKGDESCASSVNTSNQSTFRHGLSRHKTIFQTPKPNPLFTRPRRNTLVGK